LVIAGAEPTEVDAGSLTAMVLEAVASGQRLKDAVAEIAERHNVSKSELYQAALDAR
jgi:16S rRNA (cytidine1402-2'-O)-methyltransferase